MKHLKLLLLKHLYLTNRDFFYSKFIEEMMGEVPKSTLEPALGFLYEGRERLTKWLLYHAYILQKRIQDEPQEIYRTQGMLLYLKLLLFHVNQSTRPSSEIKGSPEKPKEDPIKVAEEFAKNFKKGMTERKKPKIE